MSNEYMKKTTSNKYNELFKKKSMRHKLQTRSLDEPQSLSLVDTVLLEEPQSLEDLFHYKNLSL